ncbi:MAG: ROK family protein [Bacillota bacterium]
MPKSSLTNEDLKLVNRSAVLKKIFQKGTISRKELEGETGLAHATIIKLVNELINSGLVVEVGSDSETKRLGGPNPVLLGLNDKEFYVLAIHVGTSTILISLVNLRARIIEFKAVKIRKDLSPDELMTMVDDCVKRIETSKGIIMQKNVLGIGVSIGGIVDTESGVITWHDIKPLRQFPIRKALESHFGVPTFIDNVIGAIALAEAELGRGVDLESFVFVYVAGIVGFVPVFKGELLRGGRNVAGQIGHSVVKPDGPLCSCGKQGCLNSIVSRDAVIERSQALMKQKETLLYRWINEPSEITHKLVVRASIEGDQECQKILKERGKYLGKVIGEIVNNIDPQKIILGIYSKHPNYYRLTDAISINTAQELSKGVYPQILSEIECRALIVAYEEALCFKERIPPIVFVPLGREVTMVGAAILAIQKILSPRLAITNKNTQLKVSL